MKKWNLKGNGLESLELDPAAFSPYLSLPKKQNTSLFFNALLSIVLQLEISQTIRNISNRFEKIIVKFGHKCAPLLQAYQRCLVTVQRLTILRKNGAGYMNRPGKKADF